MDELRAAIRVVLGPLTHGESFIEVRCYCDFEGHGRASETWEEHWEIRLPQMPDRRFGRAGDFPLRVHGRTWGLVKAKALAAIRECE